MLCGMIRIDLDWSQEGILTSHKCTVAHKDTGGKNIQASWASAHGWNLWPGCAVPESFRVTAPWGGYRVPWLLLMSQAGQHKGKNSVSWEPQFLSFDWLSFIFTINWLLSDPSFSMSGQEWQDCQQVEMERLKRDFIGKPFLTLVR